MEGHEKCWWALPLGAEVTGARQGQGREESCEPYTRPSVNEGVYGGHEHGEHDGEKPRTGGAEQEGHQLSTLS